MLHRFTDHPASVNETYFQHMGMAFSFAGRMLLEGKGVREVAGLLKVSKSAVSRWKQAVERKGLDGLASKPHPGPAPR